MFLSALFTIYALRGVYAAFIYTQISCGIRLITALAQVLRSLKSRRLESSTRLHPPNIIRIDKKKHEKIPYFKGSVVLFDDIDRDC